MKKCKYHCDYGDGEYCHYKEEGGCVFNKGRTLTDAESMGMLFDDGADINEIEKFLREKEPFMFEYGNNTGK